MPDSKISNLTELTSPQTTDVLPIVDGLTSTTKKVQVNNLNLVKSVNSQTGNVVIDLSPYQVTSEKGAANGYASLDATTRVPKAELTYHNHTSGFEGAPIFTEGTGTYTMGSIECWFYDDATRDEMTLHTIAASGSLIPNESTDGAETYVCADRDTDTWVQLSSIPVKDDVRYEPAYLVVKRTSSNNLHSQPLDRQSHGDMEAMYDSDVITEKYSIKPGDLLGLAVDTSLNITLAGGDVYVAKRHKHVIPAVTTATRQFKCSQNTGVWTITSNTTPVANNTQWNDTTSGLVTLTDTYWNIMYVYRGIEEQDHLYTVLSTQEFATSDLAKADNSLPVVPTLISSHAMFVGRIITQKNATIGIICESAFTTVFGASSAVTVHNSLSGRSSSDAHPTSAITGLDTALGNKQPLATVLTNTTASYTTTIDTRIANTSGTNTGDQTISDVTISTTDITTNDVSTSKHGFFPKLPTAAGKFLRDDMSWQTVSGGTETEVFGITIDGSGTAITTGSKGYRNMPFDCTITGWTITGKESGSIVIDVKKCTYAGFPTTSSIAGSEKPTLSSAQKNQDLTLSTWTTTVTAGDIIEFVVDSASTVTRVNLLITYTK